jgi:peptidoglycan-associated lipoprotein
MNRLLKHALIFFLLVLTFACQKKKDEIPAPTATVEPPRVEKPAEPVEDTVEPMVEEVPEPDPLDDFFNGRNVLEDVHFDFDKSDLRDDAKEIIERHAEVIRANPGLKVLIEGHCDERGTEDYNLALGERRAERVREYMISLGVSAESLRTISYGELRPVVDASNEAAWAENRRAHFTFSR